MFVSNREILRAVETVERKVDRANERLIRIERAVSSPPVVFGFTVSPPVPKQKETSTMPLTVQSTNEEKILITVNPSTTTEKPAELDGPVQVTVNSGNATVELVDDRSFFVISPDAPGSTEFVVRGDADLGEGVVPIQDTIIYNVVGALAANLGLTAGAPVPK